MTDILLTHSYHLPYDRKQVRKMQPYPPLATLYAAATLRQRGFSVALFDTMLEDPVTGFTRVLNRHRPKIVVVYEDDFNFLSKMCLTRMREVAWNMAQQALAANAVTIAHGSDATDHRRDFLLHGFDFVLLGEAADTLAQLCEVLLRGGDAQRLPGVSTLDDTGQLVTVPRPASSSPSVLGPLPARDLLDLDRYRNAWKHSHGYFSLNLISSRGCPFRCNWCAKPIFGDGFAVRPAAEVVQEMRLLVNGYGAEHLWFADDVFGLNRHWIQEFAAAAKETGTAIPFKIQSRADLMTKTTAGALGSAGCVEVWMGVESGSQPVLDAMEKGLRVEQVQSARENLCDNGIRACYFLQFGYPGESWKDILATVELVRSTRPDDIGISFSYPLPGTRFHARVREQLGAKRNWTDSDDLCVMFKGAYTDSFYRSVRDALHAEVNSWNGSGPQLSPAEVAAVWREIERNERSSRNSDVTLLPPAAQRTEDSDGFVPLGRLTSLTGVNLG